MLNLHIHSTFSDGKENPRLYAREAATLGFKAIGFTEHLIALPDGSYPPHSIRPEQIPNYIDEIDKLRADVKGDLEVLCGLEVDYIPEMRSFLKRTLKDFSFDFLTVSVHRLGGWVIDIDPSSSLWRDMSKEEVTRIYRRYFDLVKEAIDQGIFGIVAHIDLVKKFRRETELEPLLDDAVQYAKNSGMILEINTAGLRHPVGESYPSIHVAVKAYEEGIQLTLGTDAHDVSLLTYGLNRVLQELKQSSIRHLVYLVKRKRRIVRI